MRRPHEVDFMERRHLLAACVLTACGLLQTPVCLAQTAVLQGMVETTGMPDVDAMTVPAPELAPPVAPQRGGAHFRGTALSPKMAPIEGNGERPTTYVNTAEDHRTYFQKHPKVKATVIGAGVGAAGGAVVGLVSHRGLFRGAAIGAGVGAGTGLIRSSDTLKRHPMVRDVATGTAVGLGLGWAASRRGSTIGKAGALGALGGLGYSFLKKL
jgi:hypothetical protein